MYSTDSEEAPGKEDDIGMMPLSKFLSLLPAEPDAASQLRSFGKKTKTFHWSISAGGEALLSLATPLVKTWTPNWAAKTKEGTCTNALTCDTVEEAVESDPGWSVCTQSCLHTHVVRHGGGNVFCDVTLRIADVRTLSDWDPAIIGIVSLVFSGGNNTHMEVASYSPAVAKLALHENPYNKRQMFESPKRDILLSLSYNVTDRLLSCWIRLTILV